MDIIIGFPMTMKKHDSIMVVVNKLSKVAHFILVKSTIKASDIVNIFMTKVFILNGFPKVIV